MYDPMSDFSGLDKILDKLIWFDLNISKTFNKLPGASLGVEKAINDFFKSRSSEILFSERPIKQNSVAFFSDLECFFQ